MRRPRGYTRMSRYPVPAELPPAVVLFDGVCAVCDAGMQWLLDHDTANQLHYAPLQGDVAAAVRARHPEIPAELDSIVFVEQTPDGERVSWHTDALLRVVSRLPSPWRHLRLLRIVPWFVRDPLYRAFAAVRYRVFGKLEACRIPKPGEAERFLE